MNKVRLISAMLAIASLSTTATAQQTDTFSTNSGKQVVITPIKHGSLRITCEGKEFEIDPVGPMKPETDYSLMPKADYIIVTHEHFDHLDTTAIRKLTKASTRIIANPNSATIIGHGEAMRNGEKKTLEDNITIEAVAAHNHAERNQFHPAGRDNGYILTIDGLRIYIAGDTEDIEEMNLIKDIDVAFLPCNQPYTMTPEQLTRAARTIRPKVLFPYHFSETPVEQVVEMLRNDNIDVRIRNYQ